MVFLPITPRCLHADLTVEAGADTAHAVKVEPLIGRTVKSAGKPTAFGSSRKRIAGETGFDRCRRDALAGSWRNASKPRRRSRCVRRSLVPSMDYYFHLESAEAGLSVPAVARGGRAR